MNRIDQHGALVELGNERPPEVVRRHAWASIDHDSCLLRRGLESTLPHVVPIEWLPEERGEDELLGNCSPSREQPLTVLT